MTRIGSISVLALLAALAACAPKQIPLAGERLDPRDVTGSGAALDVSQTGAALASEGPRAVAISLPAQTRNAEWTHRGGSASHDFVNAAIGAGTTPVWTAPIGAGAGRKHRITADPVVAQGRIFTLDSRAGVVATSEAGATLWSSDLTPAGERADDASGGGLATSGGKVFVSTGFGELVALDAATGAVIWRQELPAAVGGAPAVSGDLVYVVSRDSTAYAIRTSDGKIQWQLAGLPSRTGVTGVAGPGVDGQIVVFPFGTGDLKAVLKKGGRDLWTGRVAGNRLGRAYTAIRDVTGDPVIAGGRVYAGTSAGRMTAFDARSGAEIWSATQGPLGPVQVAGGSVFLVSDNSQLVRLDAATGAQVWAIDLPYYVPVSKDKKRRDIRAHYGPVLAGGKLFVASSDDTLRVFDPVSGQMTATAPIAGGASSAPVVANGTLYVVSADGVLHAYR
ncbi:PQQ-binding-like beta-propeller repeat protein [Albirhodobacter sp. R86504]|uniref:outer membrane protein assembly factor BamB family protein n=1 Tax=Albirhodobacter sp. R86504 TaxID=3093848 RepID=UPI0036701383